jgi:hypothetical protein
MERCSELRCLTVPATVSNVSNQNAVTAGGRLRERRVDLGYVKRARFMRHLLTNLGEDAPSDRLVASLERGERDNYDTDTVRAVDHWYELPSGTFERWLKGQDDDGRDSAATSPGDARPKPTITTTDAAGNVIPGPATGASGLDLAELHRNIKEVAEALKRIDERLNEQDRRPGVGDRL